MNALLRNISENASADLCKLIEEGAGDILKAIHKTEEEAQANDAKPKFALGFKITVDFDAASYACDLSWSLKQTLGTCHAIEDPNQPALPLEGDDTTVRIVSGNSDSGEVKLSTFKDAVKKINSRLKK